MAPSGPVHRYTKCEAAGSVRVAAAGSGMTSERWEQIARVFDAALGVAPPEREAFVREACGGDREIWEEVERLLAQDDSAGEFLDAPLVLPTDLGRNTLEAGQDVAAGRFRIARFLASGGMGEVYDAYDRDIGVHVALKTVTPALVARPEVREQFRREVQLARSVTHRNVCRVHDVFGVDGSGPLFLTMELIEGTTLAERLRLDGPLAPDRALEVLRQVALGLEAAHSSGVVHRDLKCANVILAGARGAVAGGGEWTRAVVMDFGIASPMRDGEAGFLAGSPAYMAPEQQEGRPVTPACDIYSLGVIAFEIVTGKLPQPGWEIEHARLPRRWRQAIERALDTDPARRPPTAGAFVAALEPSAEGIATRRNLLLTLTGGLLTSAAALIEGRNRGAGGATLGSMSIAVLPFETEEKDLRPIAAGLAGDVIRALATSPLLHVSGETSVRAAQGAWTTAARRLGVEHVLSGRLSRSGEDVVAEARIRGAANQSVEWEQTVEVPSGQVARLPRAIAQLAAAAMRVQLGAAFATQTQPEASDEAYQHYLLARAAALERSAVSLAESVRQYEAALQLSPRFGPAYAGMSVSLNILAGTSKHPLAATFRRSEEAGQRALGLDATLGEAHLSLASIAQRRDWDWALSERRYQSALVFSPGMAMAHQWRSGLLSILRRPEEAVAEATRAVALEPLALPPKAALSGMLYRARRYGGAARQLRLILQLNNGYQPAWNGLGTAYRMLGNYAASLEANLRAVEMSKRAPEYVAGLGSVYAAIGRRAEAEEIVAELERRWPLEQFYPWALVEAHRDMGNLEAAFRWMAVAVAQRDPNVSILAADPANDPFRGDPRFIRYVQELRL